MKKIELIPGDDSTAPAAFDLQAMKEAGVGADQLSQALAHALTPFACFLRDGCGFGVISVGDGASVVGIDAEGDGDD